MMHGECLPRCLGPGPRLVLAMPCTRSGQVQKPGKRSRRPSYLTTGGRTRLATRTTDRSCGSVVGRGHDLLNLQAFLDGKYHLRTTTNDCPAGGLQFKRPHAPLQPAWYVDASRPSESGGRPRRPPASQRCPVAALAAAAAAKMPQISANRSERAGRKQARAWLQLDLTAWGQEVGQRYCGGSHLVGKA